MSLDLQQLRRSVYCTCLWDLCGVILIGDRFSFTKLSPTVSEMQIADPIKRSNENMTGRNNQVDTPIQQSAI